MIVDRRSVMPKRGRRRDAVRVLKELYDLWESEFGPITHRIYRPKIAPFDLVIFEGEFENMAEWDRLWDEYTELPGLAPLLSRWSEATEAGGTHEIFELED